MTYLALPPRLQPLDRRFALEEGASTLRHDVRNRLSSVRNAAFYLERKVTKAAPALLEADPRVNEFFKLIESELLEAEKTLASRLPALPDHDVRVVEVRALLAGLVADLALPAGVTVDVEGS